MLYTSRCMKTLYLLFMACFGLELITARTIDEIIAGSSKDVTDFDFMGDINGHIVRVELDMLMTLKQYQSLYSKSSASSAGATAPLSRKKRKAIKPETRRWTNKEIPYIIQNSVYSTQDIAEVHKAIREWQDNTCIKFRPATSADLNFVNFEDGTGCSSYVGMNGGKHPIALAGECRQKGVIVHEIGHAVGFYHEQNRPDRDDYVTIQTQNILHPNLNYNFEKYPWSAVSTYNVPYDYRSIMHYGGRAFSGNGQYTIKTKDKSFQEVIGNREGLSFSDIKLANLMYNCNDKCNQNIVCPGDGFVGKDCQCSCRGDPIQKCNGSLNVKPTEMPCKDMNAYCEAWAKAGFCQTNSYVTTYCKESCSLCSGSSRSLPQCKDLREHCQMWKNQGLCTNVVFQTFMTEKCPKSCGSGICNVSSRIETTKGSNGMVAVMFNVLILVMGVVCSLVR